MSATVINTVCLYISVVYGHRSCWHGTVLPHPTNDRGGALDILPKLPCLMIFHHQQSMLVCSTTTCCDGRFRSLTRDAVSSSSLSRPELWASFDADDLLRLYDSEMTAILDRLVPHGERRHRASDPGLGSTMTVARRGAPSGFSSLERLVL